MIDTVANGLKFALNTDEIEYEKIKVRNESDQNEELRIQELYRKVYEEDTKDYRQKFINETNFDNGNHKSIRSVIFLGRYFILSIYELNRLITNLRKYDLSIKNMVLFMLYYTNGNESPRLM